MTISIIVELHGELKHSATYDVNDFKSNSRVTLPSLVNHFLFIYPGSIVIVKYGIDDE